MLSTVTNFLCKFEKTLLKAPEYVVKNSKVQSILNSGAFKRTAQVLAAASTGLAIATTALKVVNFLKSKTTFTADMFTQTNSFEKKYVTTKVLVGTTVASLALTLIKELL